MSFLFGGGKKQKPSYTGLQLQTSSSSIPVTIAWGTNRFAPNIIWYGDFKAHKQKKKAGKGAPKTTTYTYTVSCILSLCEGVVPSIGKVWKDKDLISGISEINLSLFTGTDTQTAWGYLTTRHPTEALAYRQTAYLAGANYDLGENASLPNHTFEVKARLSGSAPWTDGDADVAEIVREFLLEPQFGVGFNAAFIDNDQLFSGPDATTTGDSSYQTYCRAMGFGLSPVLSDQQPAGDTLSRWMQLTNSEVVWTGYTTKFIPYAYQDVTGNGVKFIANAVSLYTLTDDHIISDGEDPIKVDRIAPEDAHNTVKITINDKSYAYNEKPVTFKDQSMIENFGERSPSAISAPEVTDAGMASVMVSLIGARAAYVRNTYFLTIGPEYILLEPMDIITVIDAKLGEIDIQLTTITEDDDGNLSIEASQVLDQTAVTSGFPVQPSAGDQPNNGVTASAINPPLLVEPPADLSGGTAQVWAAVSGGNGTTFDPNWGGCVVYVSTDNVSFQAIGEINSPARMGRLTAALPAYPGVNPDTTSTLSVNMSMSGAELISVDPADAEDGSTLVYVGGEFLSYQNATLTSGYTYNINTIWRGLYRSPTTSKPSNTLFARLDENVFEYDLLSEYVGRTLYFKFQSYNIWGGGYQDLADCVAYTYTPTGEGFKIAAPAAIGLAFANRTQSDGTNIITGTITIGTPSTGPYLDHYDVQITLDGGTTWIDVPSISASGNKSSFEPAVASTNYRARVRAVSATFDGVPSAWVQSAIVNSGTLGGTPPNAPTDLAGTPGTLSNLLTWDPPAAGSPVSGYKIYAIHSNVGNFGSAGLIGTSPNPFFTHAGLGVSDTWRYWVVAYNAAGNSTELGPVNVTTSSSGGGGGGSIIVKDNGVTVDAAVTSMDFVGGVDVTALAAGSIQINVEGTTGGGSNISRDFLGALIYATAAQTFTSGAWTKINFNTVSYNNGAWYNPSNPNRLTVPFGVNKVRLTGRITTDSADGQTSLRVYKNNADTNLLPGYPTAEGETTGVDSVLYSSSIVDVTPGDYFELVCYVDGGNKNSTAGTVSFGIEAIQAVAVTRSFSPISAVGTGVAQVVALPVSGLDAADVLLFVNGIRYKTSEYSISGANLNLTTNAAGDNIEIIQLAGVGGDGFEYEVAGDVSISSPVANVDVSVAEYEEVLIYVLDVPASASGIRVFGVSTDGGTSYFSGGSDYRAMAGDGTSFNTPAITFHSVGNASARSGFARISDVKGNTIKMIETLNNGDYRSAIFAANMDPITNVRVYNYSSGNLTGGRVLVLGRRGNMELIKPKALGAYSPQGFSGPQTNGNSHSNYKSLIMGEASLVNYYPMDDAGGPAAVPVDIKGGNTATKVAPFILGVEGRLDNSTCLFTNSVALAGGIGCFEIARQIQDDFTIEAWVLVSNTGVAPNYTTWWQCPLILGRDVGGTTNDFSFVLTVFGQLGMGIRADTGVFSPFPATSVIDGKWHHVAVTRVASTGNVIMYKDGVAVASATMVTGTLNASATLGAMSYWGFMQDMATYSAALTSGTIVAHYNAGKPY